MSDAEGIPVILRCRWLVLLFVRFTWKDKRIIKSIPNTTSEVATMVDRGILNGWNERVLILGEAWEPGCWDVICQGGKDSYDHGECV